MQFELAMSLISDIIHVDLPVASKLVILIKSACVCDEVVVDNAAHDLHDFLQRFVFLVECDVLAVTRTNQCEFAIGVFTFAIDLWLLANVEVFEGHVVRFALLREVADPLRSFLDKLLMYLLILTKLELIEEFFIG